MVTHYPAIAPPVIKEHKNPIPRIWDLQTEQNSCSFPGYNYVKVLPDEHKIMAIKEETRILAVLNIENGRIDSVLDDEMKTNNG